MKLQFFSLNPVSARCEYMLRLKDGVYSRVPLLPGAPVEVRRKELCEDAGAPVSQVWARALDKELYPMLITSHHIGVLEFAIPADADYYTEAEVQAHRHAARTACIRKRKIIC